MKKGDKLIVEKDGQYYELTVLSNQKSKKPKNSQSTVYNILSVAEKVAIALSLANKAAKQYKKIKKISDRLSRQTKGELKRIKPQKPAVAVKRHTVSRGNS